MDVVATAGHVDHGKSTLVRALTGMEPDRWAEERRRGMTIDLGFAWATFPTGRTVAFVDVPGHERFVGNMLAGVGAVPAALFVVAADEGWSRQSAEHLAALDALGVQHAVLAVTKCDLADPSAAMTAAREQLAATSLRDCAAVAVSATTGDGLDGLRDALDAMLAALPRPTADGRVRLWVDRSFTIRGSGTVVTGTLAAGTLRPDDDLELSGTGERARIRGLQSLGVAADEASAVARVAVNLRGIDRDSVVRGQALLTPDAWAAVDTFDVRLSRPALLPAHVAVHVGSAAVAARVRPLGETHARLMLATALPLAVGDRLVLRDPGTRDIVGARVLDVLVPPLSRRGAAARRAEELTAMADTPTASEEVTRRGAVPRRDLVRAGVIPADATTPDGVAEAAGWWVSAPQWAGWSAALAKAVAAQAHADPVHPGLPRAEAVRTAGLPDARLLDPLVAAGRTLVLDEHGVHEAGARPELPPPAAAAVTALTDALAVDPFAAPDSDDLTARGLDARSLAAAVRAGLLLLVAPGIYLLPDARERAADVLRALPQPFTTSDAKQALHTTRRVAVPLLESLDRLGITRRVDDAHRVVL